MATGFGRAPGEALTKAFEQYMANPRLDGPVQLSTFAENARSVERYQRGPLVAKAAEATNMSPLHQVQRVLRPMYERLGSGSPTSATTRTSPI